MRLFSVIHNLSGALVWCAALPCTYAAGGGSGPTLSDLAPVKLYPVAPIQVQAPVALPDPVEPAAMFYDVLLPDDTAIPDMTFDLFWGQSDFEQWRQLKPSVNSPGLRGSRRRGARPMRAAWLSAPSRDPWTLGSSNWRYAGERGLDITLGSDDMAVPVWGNTARLGGISVTQSSPQNADAPDAWRYSMAVGALDYAAAQDQGDLMYGPTAGNTVVSYRLDPQLTLESQVELAPELVTTGLGGRYKTQGWGAVSAGVARGSYGMQSGWRYQAAYDIKVLDDLHLSWVKESHTPGFVDLSRYQDAGGSVGGVRDRFTATIPLGRWGDLAGIYENSRSSLGDVQRRFGFTQQFWYSPNLRIGLQAERQLVTGDYDVGIRFSVPIN